MLEGECPQPTIFTRLLRCCAISRICGQDTGNELAHCTCLPGTLKQETSLSGKIAVDRNWAYNWQNTLHTGTLSTLLFQSYTLYLTVPVCSLSSSLSQCVHSLLHRPSVTLFTSLRWSYTLDLTVPVSTPYHTVPVLHSLPHCLHSLPH